jgi:hypothetical protein
VQLLLASSGIVSDLQRNARCEYFCQRFPYDLVQEAARALTARSDLLDKLRGWFKKPSERDAMAASILHATHTGWAPATRSKPNLAKAYLDFAVWPKINLSHANLNEADLGHADLREANLSMARAVKANLRQGKLFDADQEKHLRRCGAILEDRRAAF